MSITVHALQRPVHQGQSQLWIAQGFGSITLRHFLQLTQQGLLGMSIAAQNVCSLPLLLIACIRVSSFVLLLN